MKMLSLLLCVVALGGCSHKAPEPQADPSSKTAQSAAVSTPWDDLRKDEQRAKDVQKISDQQAADQRKQLDDADQ